MIFKIQVESAKAVLDLTEEVLHEKSTGNVSDA